MALLYNYRANGEGLNISMKNRWQIEQPSSDEFSDEEEIELQNVSRPESTGPLIQVNVGGQTFSLRYSNVMKHPLTLLAQILPSPANCTIEQIAGLDYYVSTNGPIFIDRSSTCFDEVLNLYRKDVLHIPTSVCAVDFLDELKFWRVEPSYISECCRSRLLRPECVKLLENWSPKKRPKEGVRSRPRSSILPVDTSTLFSQAMANLRPKYRGQCCISPRLNIWVFMNHPTASKSAMGFEIFSNSLIGIALLLLIVASLPIAQYKVDSRTLCPEWCGDWNSTYIVNSSTYIDPEYEEITVFPALKYVDIAIVIWFTLEYVTRLITCHSPWIFIKSPMACIDLLAILPFYIEVLLSMGCVCSSTIKGVSKFMLVMRLLRILRIFRVLRILKLAKYSTGIQVIVKSLTESGPELSMLSIFIFVATTICSCLMYYLEENETDTGFYTIPQAAWWAIVTLTTTGYGDVVPKTVFGKVFASLISLGGVILLAFPVSIIIEKFTRSYRETKLAQDLDYLNSLVTVESCELAGHETLSPRKSLSSKLTLSDYALVGQSSGGGYRGGGGGRSNNYS